VFEPFFTTKRQGEGTGLGLATVYGVLSDAGGSLSVHSEEGKGTTFRAYFPTLNLGSPAQRPSRATAPTSTGGGTILVVEDNPATMRATTRILRRNGYTVLEATSGDVALRLVADRAPQLVLTDSVLPQTSGQGLAERIGEIRPELPILFMSCYPEGIVRAKHLADENMSFIPKPFTEQALVARVHAILTGEGSRPGP
jgi:two-component system, cell cycle sensor histidine kinase and response regulator CckA